MLPLGVVLEMVGFNKYGLEAEASASIGILSSVVEVECASWVEASLLGKLLIYFHLGLGFVHGVGEEEAVEEVGGGIATLTEHGFGLLPEGMVDVAEQEDSVSGSE